jgi:deoxyribodipyrimidine photo-lyase
MANEKVLIYLFRNDLRVADHPVLDYLASVDHGFTHLLPVYVFPALQMDLSGFIQDEEQKQRFQVKTSRVGHFPRCGPYRAKFIAESVWDLKSSLKSLDSDLLLRVGEHAEVVEDLVDAFQSRKIDVGAVWMTGHVGSEEQDQEQAVSAACKVRNVKCKIWQDEKYFIDE